MALKSTIYKISVHLADMDREYYDTLNLTIAQHPSETEQRLFARMLAFVLNAHEHLSFGKGVSEEDEAAIWQINYAEQIELWIELGQPDEKRLKKASNRADKVKLYCYNSSSDVWWNQNKNKCAQFKRLSVIQFSPEQISLLSQRITRTMEIQVSIQDDQLWLTLGEETILIEQISLQ